MTISAPRWDLSNVYPSLESKEFKAAVENYKKQVAALEKFFKNKLSKANAKTKAKELAPLVGKAIDQINKIQTSQPRSSRSSIRMSPRIHATKWR